MNPRKYWVIIDKQGDSYFTAGSAIPYEEFEEERKKVLDRGGKPPTIRIRFEEPPGNGNGKLLPALKPFEPYKFAEYVLRSNTFSDYEIPIYSGITGMNPLRVPDRIWAEVLAGIEGEFVKMGDLYVVKTPAIERPADMRAAPTWREITPLMSTEPSSPNPTRFTKGQPIVIKSKAIYGWRAWVTVKKDDPEHNQVWVKEIPRAVKYEDIEEEEEYKPDLNASTIDLLAATEGDPLRKFCCRQCGECAPAELLEEGRFPDRIAWLRHHYKEKHPGMWGKVQPAVIPQAEKERKTVACFYEMAEWFAEHRREMTTATIRQIASKYFGMGDELTEFYEYLVTPQGTKEFRKILREVGRRHGIEFPPEREYLPMASISEELKQPAVIPTEPSGKCYEDAWRFIKKEEEGKLIHGSIESQGKRIGHAWVETETGYIWEPEHNIFFTKPEFAKFKPIEDVRYSVDDAMIMAVRAKNTGPWTEQERKQYLRVKSPAVTPTQPSPPSPKQELEFVSDSPEYLAFTIEDIGYREKLDTAFETAIARAKGA